MAGCPMGRWPPTWKSEIRKLSEVRGRRFRVALPADRDSWVAGTRPAAQSATGPHSGQNAGGADERRNCDERIVFLSMTCCAIRGATFSENFIAANPGRCPFEVRRSTHEMCPQAPWGCEMILPKLSRSCHTWAKIRWGISCYCCMCLEPREHCSRCRDPAQRCSCLLVL